MSFRRLFFLSTDPMFFFSCLLIFKFYIRDCEWYVVETLDSIIFFCIGQLNYWLMTLDLHRLVFVLC